MMRHAYFYVSGIFVGAMVMVAIAAPTPFSVCMPLMFMIYDAWSLWDSRKKA